MNENDVLIKFIASTELPKNCSILDVGCGFGKKLMVLQSNGFFNISGVDINPQTVDAVRKVGFSCAGIDEVGGEYDVILMSHIIEHVGSAELLPFMEKYLALLKTGGYLIIATPLLTSYFYDDPTHVKPYTPAGINNLFCNENAQVSAYAKTRLQFVDVWFRRDPLMNIFYPRRYGLRDRSRFPILANLFRGFLFWISLGAIGTTNGWMGLYKKL
jgi:SAM-dependent methyltransferase